MYCQRVSSSRGGTNLARAWLWWQFVTLRAGARELEALARAAVNRSERLAKRQQCVRMLRTWRGAASLR